MRMLVKARQEQPGMQAVCYLQVVEQGFVCNPLAIYTEHISKTTIMFAACNLYVESTPHAHVHEQLKLGNAKHETAYLGHHRAGFLPWLCASSASSPHTLPFQQATSPLLLLGPVTDKAASHDMLQDCCCVLTA